MNFRNIALVAALVSVAGVANAQSFELRAGNNVTGIVGNTIKVAQTGNFTVEVWFNPGASYHVTSISNALAFDRTTSAATSGLTNADRVFGKLSYVSSSTAGAILPPIGSTTVRGALTPTGTANIGIVNGNQRAMVAARQLTVGSGNAVLLNGSAFKVMTFTFSHSIANGATYGTGTNETGLQMYFAALGGTNQNGSSGVANGAATWDDDNDPDTPGVPTTPGAPGQIGSMKYNVQAVPEPTTMAALGLGLAAIARRRRNKK